MKKTLALCLTTVLGLAAIPSCAHRQSLQLANEITFSLDGVTEIVISYDEEPVTFYEGEYGELVVKEFMTENKSSYHAKAERRGDSIQISEGGKPLFHNGFSRCIEVYFPLSYQDNLTVTTTDGDLDVSKLGLSLNELHINSTAGMVQLGDVKAQNLDLSTTSGTLDAEYLKADQIRIDTTSGTVSCERLEGKVNYTTTSGDLEIQSAIGFGDYTASNSGQLNLVYTEVTGNLSFLNKNGGIQVILPADLEFEFQAETKNGSVMTSFQTTVSADGRTAAGMIGGHPTVTIKAETKNGDIEVTQ